MVTYEATEKALFSCNAFSGFRTLDGAIFADEVLRYFSNIVRPLNPLFPLASKAVAMFKSPHTGNLGESHCGGRVALALRLAGFGALVIQGRSEVPVYLAIHRGRVQFRDARALWGLSSSLTVGRVLREIEPGSGARTILRIGRAGERLVTYANVIAETYRHFGRRGLGAVFGSKKHSAIKPNRCLSESHIHPVPRGTSFHRRAASRGIFGTATRLLRLSCGLHPSRHPPRAHPAEPYFYNRRGFGLGR